MYLCSFSLLWSKNELWFVCADFYISSYNTLSFYSLEDFNPIYKSLSFMVNIFGSFRSPNNSPPCFQARVRTACQWRRGPILEFPDNQTPSLCQPHGLLHHGLWVHLHFLHHILHRGGGAGNKGSQMVVLQQHLQHSGSCCHHSKYFELQINTLGFVLINAYSS